MAGEAAARKGYLPAPGGQVHYRAAGARGPHAFLLHLTPFSSRQYEACLPLLGAGLRAYALDTPGYGLSDPPPGPTTIADYGARLFGAIDTVTTGPFGLCGFSTGSVIAMEIARRVPDRVTRMVLSTTPLMSAEDIRAMASKNVGKPAMAADGAHLVTAWRGRQGIWGADLDPAILQAATADIIQCYDRYHWGLEAVMACDVAALLRTVRCPTLFLSGERDSHSGPNRAAAAIVPGACHEDIAGVGAPVSATAPRAYADRVLSFLQA